MRAEDRFALALAVLLWAVGVAIALATRSAMPVDETRYLAVAWEMWRSGEYIVPSLNGVEYHHKPPLLFWLINAGWALFGVSEIWARLVAPLFGLGCLLLTAHLARLLFPERPAMAGLAPLVLSGALFFASFGTLTFFDSLIAFFTLLGLIGVVTAAQGRAARGWTIYGLAIGLGILSKGPVQLLDLAPVALLAPLWLRDRPVAWKRWYGGFALAVLGGAAIGLAWAMPAALRGSPEFAYMLFVGQSAKRVVEATWHERPFWWYVPLSFLLLFPWLWWPSFFRSLANRAVWSETGVRFCLATFVPVFVAFSAISGKQPHYLLPLLPIFALLLARFVDAASETGRFSDSRLFRLPPLLLVVGVGLALIATQLMTDRLVAWRPRIAELLSDGHGGLILGLGLMGLALWIAFDRARDARFRIATLTILSVATVSAAQFWVGNHLRERFNVAVVAAELANAEAANRPVAVTYDYHGQYHFAGRLARPIRSSTKDDVLDWVKSNPNGLVVDYRSEDPATYPAQPSFVGEYRGRYVLLWPAAAVAMHGRDILFDRKDRPGG